MSYKQVSIITKRWRQEKPPIGSQLNFGHPLSQGLVGCWLMNEGGGRIVKDLINISDGLLTSVIWKSNSLSFNGTTSLVNCGSRPKLDNLQISGGSRGMTASAIIFAISAGEGNLGRIMGKDNTTVFNSGFWVFRVGASGALRFAKSSSTDGLQDIGRTANINSILFSRWHHVLVTWNGSMSSTSIHIYVDSKEVSYSAAVEGSSAISDSSLNFIIGNREDAGVTFNGQISNVMLWNRALSPSEVMALYEAPYQMIQPIRRRFYIQVGAPPPITTRPRRRLFVGCG